jgi:hypothetical protein
VDRWASGIESIISTKHSLNSDILYEVSVQSLYLLSFFYCCDSFSSNLMMWFVANTLKHWVFCHCVTNLTYFYSRIHIHCNILNRGLYHVNIFSYRITGDVFFLNTGFTLTPMFFNKCILVSPHGMWEMFHVSARHYSHVSDKGRLRFVINPFISQNRDLQKKLKLFLCLINQGLCLQDMGEWRYSSTNFDLGIRWRWVISVTPRPLHPLGNNLHYSLSRRLDGPQSRS